jgi:hypothetical protein
MSILKNIAQLITLKGSSRPGGGSAMSKLASAGGGIAGEITAPERLKKGNVTLNRLENL